MSARKENRDRRREERAGDEKDRLHADMAMIGRIMDMKEPIMEQIRDFRYRTFYPNALCRGMVAHNSKTKKAQKALAAYNKAFAIWQDALPGVPEIYAMMTMREALGKYRVALGFSNPNWIRPMSDSSELAL